MTWCIVGMTLLSIALTVTGGMKAVIWTDVAQTIILLGAVIIMLVVLVARCDGDIPAIVDIVHMHGKMFEQIDWSSSLVNTTGWVVLIGLGFSNFISYTSNQEVVLRYLTTRDIHQSAKAVWANSILSLRSGALFFTVGTALFVFYHRYPERLDPTIQIVRAIHLVVSQEKWGHGPPHSEVTLRTAIEQGSSPPQYRLSYDPVPPPNGSRWRSGTAPAGAQIRNSF